MSDLKGLKGWNEDMITVSMQTEPDMWAKLLLEQDQTIKELHELLNASNARLQLVLMDYDLESHH